jgi:hypothetical protein
VKSPYLLYQRLTARSLCSANLRRRNTSPPLRPTE